MQADSVEHLRKLLNVASGGVVFTTIQNFIPEEKGGKAGVIQAPQHAEQPKTALTERRYSDHASRRSS